MPGRLARRGSGPSSSRPPVAAPEVRRRPDAVRRETMAKGGEGPGNGRCGTGQPTGVIGDRGLGQDGRSAFRPGKRQPSLESGAHADRLGSEPFRESGSGPEENAGGVRLGAADPDHARRRMAGKCPAPPVGADPTGPGPVAPKSPVAARFLEGTPGMGSSREGGPPRPCRYGHHRRYQGARTGCAGAKGRFPPRPWSFSAVCSPPTGGLGPGLSFGRNPRPPRTWFRNPALRRPADGRDRVDLRRESAFRRQGRGRSRE